MKLFISYATQDLKSFIIHEIVKFLEAQKDIEKVWYWDRDSKDFSSIISYMEFGITNCTGCIFFLSIIFLRKLSDTNYFYLEFKKSKKI